MSPPRPRAFTLVELLTVIAVISVLIALVGPSLGAGNAKNVTIAGNLVLDLASRAREEAVARGAMVALVLLNGTSHTDWNNRSFILVERAPGATIWTPVTAWTSLPTGVVVDATQSTAFTDSGNQPAVGTLNLPPCAGTAVTDSQCAYQIFLPGGGLASNSANPSTPPLLRFVPAGRGTGAHDTYDVIVNRFTGIPKADRP